MEQQEYRWTGRPDYMPFLIQQVIETGGMIIFLLCIYAFYYLIQDTSGEVVSWTMLHVVFGFVFLGQAYDSVKKIIEYRYLYYRISADKVEIIKGKKSRRHKGNTKGKNTVYSGQDIAR